MRTARVRLFCFLLGFVLTLLLGGCVGLDPGYASFVAAERQTKTSVGAEYLDYVWKDEKLTMQQKQWRQDHVENWENDLRQAESRIGGGVR